MKLYYPTTSLNLNDMLATESISPKSFYEQRGFGTKRHFTTELSLGPDFITLFLSPPEYNLVFNQESEYDEYPLVLELEVNNTGDFLLVSDDGIYVTQKTIYFSIDSVRFRFFEEEHVKRVIAKTKIVEEVKTLAKYRNSFILINRTSLKKYFIYKAKVPRDGLINLTNEIEFDRYYNVLKGFLYSFYSKYLFCTQDTKAELISYLKRSVELSNRLPIPYNNFLQEGLNFLLKCLQPITISGKFLLIDKVNEDKEIQLNKIEGLSSHETTLYQVIINWMVYYMDSPKSELKKSELESLIDYIKTSSPELFEWHNSDFNKIKKRFIKRDYSVGIDAISSIVLKNFMLFLQKDQKLDELEQLIDQHDLKAQFLVYGLIGVRSGYSGLSRIITQGIYRDNELLNLIENQLTLIFQQIRKTFVNSKRDSQRGRELVYEKYNQEADLYSGDLFDNSKPNGEDRLLIDIYSQIQRVRQSKVLNGFLRVKEVRLENKIRVHFSKVNEDVYIKFMNEQKVTYCVLLRYFKNLTEDELQKFKKKLVHLGLNKSVSQGNFPVFYFFKGEDVSNTLSNIEMLELLSCLNLLN